MFYSRSLTEAFIGFGSMCPISQIGKNHVNRQKWHSIIVQFSEEVSGSYNQMLWKGQLGEHQTDYLFQ